MVWAKTQILYLLFNSVCVSVKIFGYHWKYFNKTLAGWQWFQFTPSQPVNIYLESLKTSSFDGSFPLILKWNSHQKEDSFIDEKLSKCLSCHKSINKCIFPSSFCDNFLIPSGYKNRKYYFRKVMPKMEPMVNRQILSLDWLICNPGQQLIWRCVLAHLNLPFPRHLCAIMVHYHQITTTTT